MTAGHKNEFTTNAEQTSASRKRLTPLVYSIGVMIALTTIIICSYLLFKLFNDPMEAPETFEPQQQALEAPQINTPIATEDTPAVATPDKDEPTIEVKTAPLPSLADSDQEVRTAMLSLNPKQQWAGWVTTDDAVRKFVVVIDNLAAGKIAHKHLSIPKLKQSFKPRQEDAKFTLDTEGYKRYTSYIRLFKHIDTDMTVKVYQHYLPLLEEAYAELGYPDRTFHDTLLKAFDVLLEAPVITGPIELIRPTVYYKFTDPALEKSSAVHKQLIRMGPENTQQLQLKIQELKTALGPIHP